MRPTPAGPVPSTSTASTTPRTTIAPETAICTQMRTMTITRLRSRAMVVKPPAMSRRSPPEVLPTGGATVGLAVPSRAGSGSPAPGSMRATRPAATRNITAVTTNIVSTLVVATTRPPMAGPMRKARLSIVLDAPLAAVSSPGCEVSDGSQASWAGRNTHPTSGVRVASTRTTHAGRVDHQRHDRCHHEHRPHQGGHEEHGLARQPVDDRGAQGRRDGDQRQPHPRPEAHELGPALAVGPHGDRGRVRPVAHERCRERELHAPQRRLAEDRAQGPPGVAQRGTTGPGARIGGLRIDRHGNPSDPHDTGPRMIQGRSSGLNGPVEPLTPGPCRGSAQGCPSSARNDIGARPVIRPVWQAWRRPHPGATWACGR